MKKRFVTGLDKIRALRFGVFLAILTIFVGSGAFMTTHLPQASADFVANVNYPSELRSEYAAAVQAVAALERTQAHSGTTVVSKHTLDDLLSQIQLDAASGHFHDAKNDLRNLRISLANWNLELKGPVAASDSQPEGGVSIPILLYHYTPPNFEEQLEHLETRGYTVIDLDEALNGMHGGALPPKPVVLTFDDGFSNQLQAFDLLKRHHMKATFYIITGGAASRWCIGAGRRYHDPLQPPSGCGDSYLTWDQVRMLDKSGLITIGGHTVNHRNLATLSPDDQRLEIIGGKEALEQQLGHKVRHFAYPYGAFNSLSIALAQEGGYVTAVTVEPGTYQPPGSEFQLRRIRDTLTLP